MTVKELIERLDGLPYDLKDAEVIVEGKMEYVKPQVIWWSDDRKQVWLGVL